MKSGAVPALPRVFARSRRRLWLELAALALLRASATAGSVLFVRAAFAALADSPESALAPTAALAGCLAADALGEAWERTAAERLGQHYVGETRSRLFAHLVDVEPRELAERGAGAVLLRLVGDLTPLRQWIAQGVVRVAVAGTVAAAALGALAWSAPALALAVGAAFALGGVATLACAGRLERSSERMRRTRGALANHLAERLSAPGLLRALGIERSERRALERVQARLGEQAVERARSIGVLRAIASGVAGAALLAALLVGGWSEPPASHASLAAALALVGLLAPGLRDLGRAHESFVEARVVRAKLLRLLALPTLPSGATQLPSNARSGPLEVRFEGVSIAGAVRDFDATVAPGRRIAIVADTDGASSGLLGLLARSVRADAGRVLVGGVDLAALARRDWRRRVGVASPRLPLLRGSLERNVLCRWRSSPPEAAARALERCELSPLVARLPHGLRTRLSARGADLSLGERRRVLLARAVLGEPGLLVLDAFDAQLDEASRACLARLIASYPGTVLFSTHDERFVRLADEVWRLDNGQVQRLSPNASGVLSPCP
jgi:ABC-type multidrug transport system fused ATPase/permease subunit